MKKLIIDVDTGIDDALALLLALKSQLCDVVGVTTVCGNVSLAQATLNTAKVLSFLGAGEYVPLVPGASKPLLRQPGHEHRVHGEDGLGGALADFGPAAGISQDFASDFLLREAKKCPGEITLVATGPLTNVALALAKEAKLGLYLKEVIFMGGVVKGPGNASLVAEYNMFADPEAAKVVLNAGLPRLSMVGLDVTRKALLTKDHLEGLPGGELKDFAKQLTAAYFERYFERNGVRACALHDPLALALALWPELFVKQAYFVDVETKSELCDGQTVCDFQNRLGKAPNVEVCLDVDATSFLSRFLACFNNPAAQT